MKTIDRDRSDLLWRILSSEIASVHLPMLIKEKIRTIQGKPKVETFMEGKEEVRLRSNRWILNNANEFVSANSVTIQTLSAVYDRSSPGAKKLIEFLKIQDDRKSSIDYAEDNENEPDDSLEITGKARKPSRYDFPERITEKDKLLFNSIIKDVEWSKLLLEYKYARSGGESNLCHAYHFILETARKFDETARSKNAKQEYQLLSETVCIWGGVPKPNGYHFASELIASAKIGSMPDPVIPMDSGWTKVAAIVTSNIKGREQTIWDSRVAIAVISLLNRAFWELPEFDPEEFPWHKQLCLIKSHNVKRNARMKELADRWWIKGTHDNEGHWRGHLVGSWVVRGMVEALNRNIDKFPFPKEELDKRLGPSLENKPEQWDTFNVGLALFMLGKEHD